MRHSPLSVFLGLLVLVQPGLGQNLFRGNAAHTGVLSDPAPAQRPRIQWRFPTGDRIASSPVFADGLIVFGSDDGNVYAVDAATGLQRWKRTTGGPVSSTPAVVGGTVSVGSYDGKFYALDARSGIVRWKFSTGGERRFEARGLHGMQPKTQMFADPFDVYLSSPVVAEGAVYFGCGDGHLYALAAGTGELRWKFSTGDVIHASPAYAEGMLYVGSWDSFLYALEASTGREKWRFKSGEDPVIHNQVGFQSSPAVANGVVYTGCRDAHLYALDAVTGKERWNFSTGLSWVITSPAVVNDRVIFGTSDTSLYHVLDAATGRPLVQQQCKAYLFSSPTVAGDLVLTGLLNGTLEARDLATGELRWEFQTEIAQMNPGWALTSEGGINGRLLYPSAWHEANTVGAYQQFKVAILSTPLVVKGVIYIGSNDGYLYALK